jgi:hypothetical protein
MSCELIIVRHYSNPHEATEPDRRGQWDSALKATPHCPKGDI